MDDRTFDRFTRAVTTTGSRRAAVAALAGGALTAFAATAADARKKRKHKKKKKQTVVTPPGPTCSDGIRNGDETGIDCGGSCPPCAVGQACTKRADCASALCVDGVCTACTFGPDNCGVNGATACFCRDNDDATGMQCREITVIPLSCPDCPAGTTACTPQGGGFSTCSKACGDG